MKTFKQFLQEKWFANVPSTYKNGAPFDVHKNPSKAETEKLIHGSEYKGLRGILHNDDVYVWDSAAAAIHTDVNDHLKLGAKRHQFISIGKDRYSSEYIHGDDQLHYVTNHPWVKKTIPNKRFFHA